MNQPFAGDTTSPEQPVSSGIRSARHARAALDRAVYFNALQSAQKASFVRLDSMLLAHRDSSARIAQFKYVRKDRPAVDGSYHKNYPLFLTEPLSVNYKDELDSTRWVYRIRRVVDDVDTRIPLDIPLEEYTELRMKKAIRKNWESMLQVSESAQQRQDALASVMSKMTSFEIPTPQTPLFSIFGKNYVRFQISGGVDLHAAFQHVKSDVYTTTTDQSTSTPEFSQQLQLNVSGEVGDKLKVSADWNTQRTFDYENQLHLNYKGYDDDIIQTIEAGNVSLQTNSSFISSSQALFGIKMGMQFGPLKVTAIASQKKGQIKELSVNNGSTSSTFSVRPNEYSQDHYFIDTSYIQYYSDYYLNSPHLVHSDYQVKDIEVWVSRVGTVSSKERKVIAYMNKDSVHYYQDHRPLNTVTYDGNGDGEMEAGAFIPLTKETDYTYNADIGVISLKTTLQTSQAIAVAYTAGPTSSLVTTGNFGSLTPSDSSWLVMKLVRPKNLASNPSLKTGWRMMLKSHYPVGGAGINKSNFSMTIQYKQSGQTAVDNVLSENISVMSMFGMDRYTGTDNSISGSDKVFDYISGWTVDESRGEIIFPTVEPFDSTTMKTFMKEYGGLTDAQASAAIDSFQFNKLYDTTATAAEENTHNRYYFVGTATSTVQSQYTIGTNVVEGSVIVTVDGQTAVLNSDYTVDYLSGTVTIRNSSYLVAGRNIQIKYEANDLFQLASKTLIGMRGELALDRNTVLGFTVMNLNEKSLSDKVRLGEEPMNNTIFGLDASTSFNAPFLTKALNWLPGIRTVEASNISLKGEYAYMSPTPNTRTSPVPEDGGKSVAYIDDFEGSLQTIPINIAYTAWKEASPPYYSSTIDTAYTVDLATKAILTSASNLGKTIMPDTSKMEYKAHALWFTIASSDVSISQIWGKRKSSVSGGQNQISVMNMYFNPSVRGTYNYSMNLESKLFSNPTKAWGGAQLVLGTTTTNLSDQNINYIQMWVKIVAGQPTAKFNIDLGYISENSYPYGDSLNTEDGLDNNGKPTGVMHVDEDVGIDGLSNGQEATKYAAFVNHYKDTHPEYADDPSGDNWKAPPTSISTTLTTDVAKTFDHCDGVEGNTGNDIGARYPDTEDLNGDGNLNTLNSYFEYEVPLDTTNAVFTKYITGQGDNGWYQISIPLKDFDRQIGSPSLTDIQGMRVWVTGASGEVLFRIAEFNLVGNQWKTEIANDSLLQVSAVNVEDDPNYVAPVPRQQDPTQTDQVVYENEQSLNLILTGLKHGQSRRAVKLFSSRTIDLLNYHTMKMLLHGETGDDSKGYKAFVFNDTTDYDARVSFRFGSDSLNYYEYSEPLRPGWDNNGMTVRFSELSSLKAVRDSTEYYSGSVPNGHPGARYAVKGSPTLTSVQYLAIEIKNVAKDTTKTIIGEVWADELRLTDVDDSPGSAYKFDASIKFADVATVAFSFTHQGPNFHSLESQFGSRIDLLSWNVSSTINFQRFLPESWTGTNLALSYSHSENYQKPQYVPGTDVLVDQAVQQVADAVARGDSVGKSPDDIRLASQTLTVTESYSLSSLRLNIPLDTWLITKTINQILFGYSYSSSFQRSPTVEWSKSWSWEAHMSYTIPFSQDNYVKPFNWLGKFFLTSIWTDLQVYFTPKTITIAATMNRSRAESRTRYQTSDNTISHSLTATRSLNFTWQFFNGKFLDLGTNYSVNVSSTLYNLETDKAGNLRSFSDILKDIFLSDRLVDFGIDQNYSQNISWTPQIKMPGGSLIGKILKPSLSYGTQYSWSNNISSGDLGKSASTSSSFRLSLDVDMRSISENIWSSTGSKTSASGDTSGGRGKKKSALQLSALTKFLFKDLLFGFDKVAIGFNQSNRVQNNGVTGGTGFSNLFARVPFVQSSLAENGPSLLYQLGLSSDPNGRVIVGTKSAFPFIYGYTIPGLRAPNGNLSDVFSQSNSVTIGTGRQLWEGARLDLNWNYAWTYSSSQTMTTDSLGQIVGSSISRTVSGSVQRSFLALPPVFIFKLFNTSIENVDKIYESTADDASITDAKRLSNAFEKGFEAFPFLSKIVGQMMPRVNWTFHWTGLEKIPLFQSFASTMSLEHAYTSSYKEQWSNTTSGDETIQSQSVAYAFSPLVGVNVDFKGMGKGTLSASCRYNSSTTFDLTPSLLQATETDQSDISATVSYRRTGFEIPFFGLSLSNDIEGSLSYSVSNAASTLFYFSEFSKNGTPESGSIRTTLEPSVKYVLSARITASVYYRYSRIAPTSSGSTVTGSTTNEGGVNLHIAIQ
jgi:cell surface protein SprA